jgi:hypothetical protein
MMEARLPSRFRRLTVDDSADSVLHWNFVGAFNDDDRDG